MSLEPDAPAPAVPRAHRQSIVELLARYDLELAGEPEPVLTSVLNQNYRVPTTGGDRFVRFHRKTRTRERLELEQDVIRHAAGRGIPAFTAVADARGRWLHALSNQFISMYQWIEGSVFQRGAITADEAAVLGDLHGRIHAALRDFRDPRLPIGGTGSRWDLETSLDDLGRVDDLIRYYPAHSDEQLRVQAALREQMELLESGVTRPAADFDHLARQCSHGDFHERNVIIDEHGSAAAVVDWEMAGLLPPVFEVIRALSFMHLLEQPLAAAYLRAYRQHAEIPDVEEGVQMWWQAQLHDTWVFRARYIEGNRAVEPYLEDHAQRLRELSRAEYREDLVQLLR